MEGACPSGRQAKEEHQAAPFAAIIAENPVGRGAGRAIGLRRTHEVATETETESVGCLSREFGDSDSPDRRPDRNPGRCNDPLTRTRRSPCRTDANIRKCCGIAGCEEPRAIHHCGRGHWRY